MKLATARYAATTGLQLERLTQPDLVDEGLSLRMLRLAIEEEGGRDGIPDQAPSGHGPRLSREQELAARERWPRERLEHFQQDRLAKLARHAAEHSPFWRDRLPSGRVDLSQLPILTKTELMERFDDIVTDRRLRRDELLEHLAQIDDDALYLGEFRVMTSSGSSGRKAVFVYDRAAWRGVLVMFLRRSAWVGMKPSLPRTRLAMIGGGAATHMSRGAVHGLRSPPAARAVRHAAARRARECAEPVPARFHERVPLDRGPARDEQLAGRLRVSLRGLTTNSEPLTPALRERLESAFGVRPTDFYATTEGVWGHDCEHGSMHLFDDMCIVENVDDDGRPLPPGEIGARLLMTNLFNTTQPLIRFEVSDLVAVDPEPCPCGRTRSCGCARWRAAPRTCCGSATSRCTRSSSRSSRRPRRTRVPGRRRATPCGCGWRCETAPRAQRSAWASESVPGSRSSASSDPTSVERVEALERSAGASCRLSWRSGSPPARPRSGERQH